MCSELSEFIERAHCALDGKCYSLVHNWYNSWVVFYIKVCHSLMIMGPKSIWVYINSNVDILKYSLILLDPKILSSIIEIHQDLIFSTRVKFMYSKSDRVKMIIVLTGRTHLIVGYVETG